MAVMTMSLKQSDIKTHASDGKKTKKSLEKCRPITATLDHPLILDIKLLQKLDMTTFTKRGLIALSKFCGISLITKNGSKIRLNQCIKAIQGSKNQVIKKVKANKSGGGGGGGGDDGYEGDDGTGNKPVLKEQMTDSVISDSVKHKRSSVKPKISRYKPVVNFKIAEVETCENVKEKVQEDEEDSDVICKNDEKSKGRKLNKTKRKTFKKSKEHVSTRKKITSDKSCDSTIEVVPEPCKSCNRSQQPERLHSHPKYSVRGIMEKKRLEERFKAPVKSKDAAPDGGNMRKSPEKFNGKGKSPCAKGPAFVQKALLSVPNDENESSGVVGSPKIRRNSGSSIKSVPSFEMVDVTVENKKTKGGPGKKIQNFSPPGRNSDENSEGDGNKTNSPKIKYEQKDGRHLNDEEALKYVTGCYICGTQVSPEFRMQHEKECITQWRSQNSVLAAEDRKPEPRRPDYRFTSTGELDFNGTFESIWANHMDSLVPCKYCGRKFFPDRIERHENCCNNLSLRLKFKN